MYDYIVIGTGYGGVASAGLLAHYGFSVLLLESHTVIGGCASFFKRKNFLFDAGATTLSGVLEHQPLGKLFKKLNITPNMKKLDPGVVIFTPDVKINRYSDKDKWVKECEDIFNEDGDYKGFWDEIYKLEASSWDLIKDNYRLPPRSLSDLIFLSKPSNIKYLNLVPGLFRSLDYLLEKYKLANNKSFKKVINEQLLISTQNFCNLAPYLTSAIGLAYPSQTYYPYGGISKPLELIMEQYLKTGNEVKFKQKVHSIKETNEGYEVKTKNNTFYSKGVISNIPIWNMAKITEGNIKKYFESYSNKFDKSWGAFTLYFAIENKVKLETAYYQIHCQSKIPYCEGNSFFVSFSLEDDREKAPEGWYTATISTHTYTHEWENISSEEYENRRNLITNFIFEELYKYFPEFRNAEKAYIDNGTPSTFEFFTGRYRGFVGGIPHSTDKNILTMPSNVTPFKNLYMTGDTVFAGQGTPAVVLGALNVAERIVRSS
jgi:C-3',4' desaturase CrtD